MSTEFPDLNDAPAWLSRNGESYAEWSLRDTVSPEELGPWTPLDTADEWVKRIDMDKLAALLAPYFSSADRAYEEHYTCADAVLAALPDLMGGGEQA